MSRPRYSHLVNEPLRIGQREYTRDADEAVTRRTVAEIRAVDPDDNATPDDVAIRWFADLLAVFEQRRWGLALWEFEGPFGVIGHGQVDARFEQPDGWLAHRRLPDLQLTHQTRGE